MKLGRKLVVFGYVVVCVACGRTESAQTERLLRVLCATFADYDNWIYLKFERLVQECHISILMILHD